MSAPLVMACDGGLASPAMARALAEVAELVRARPTAAESCARKDAQMRAGIRPRYGLWNEPLPVDEEAVRMKREAIDQTFQASLWETPVGEVVAARAALGIG